MIALKATEARFTVPPELEAREPAEVRGAGRDDVRLLVTQGPSGTAAHTRFRDLRSFLKAGDLIVVNTSATVPAALRARTTSGEAFSIHFSTRLPDGSCIVEPRNHTPSVGQKVTIEGGASLTFLFPYRQSHRLWTCRVDEAGDLIRYLYAWGKPIAYSHVRGEGPIESYQNVYASVAGSAEMPSAGRPFTNSHLADLKASGIKIAHVLLHTGVSSPERDEPPYEESIVVPPETAIAVERARLTGNRVIAVGTTAVRALESAAGPGSRIVAKRGWTDLVITPERGIAFVDGMLTGFHEPRSTHLSLLDALVGRRHVDRAYDEAIAGRYLWHEFGDSHLLLAR